MKIAIVDDDIKYANEIEKQILQYNSNFVVEKFDSGEVFLQRSQDDYKIIFLDIEMGELNGIEVGKKIREKGCLALIFYVTSHTSYISDALRNQPFQYLIKPIVEADFQKDFDIAVKKVVKSHKILKLIWQKEIVSIPIGNIMYIEFEDRRLMFHILKEKKEQVYCSAGKISDIAEKLEDYNFIICHKSFVVNMKYIFEIKKDSITLYNKSSVPTSKRYKLSVKEKYNYFLAGVSV